MVVCMWVWVWVCAWQSGYMSSCFGPVSVYMFVCVCLCLCLYVIIYVQTSQQSFHVLYTELPFTRTYVMIVLPQRKTTKKWSSSSSLQWATFYTCVISVFVQTWRKTKKNQLVILHLFELHITPIIVMYTNLRGKQNKKKKVGLPAFCVVLCTATMLYSVSLLFIPSAHVEVSSLYQTDFYTHVISVFVHIFFPHLFSNGLPITPMIIIVYTNLREKQKKKSSVFCICVMIICYIFCVLYCVLLLCCIVYLIAFCIYLVHMWILSFLLISHVLCNIVFLSSCLNLSEISWLRN